ncbi:Frag1/DRAM/Sfk1 family-domain-containing protein [Lipomyces japonicus]|uniref:Frag1/DRAM/Sfk1 family-domain-containing protein n=1 Tax=Lipomyces japonicus TaxID=56871 RepID=UPI0034CDF2A4
MSLPPAKLLEQFKYYWILPVISLLVWWGMLVAMMAVWAGNNYKIFPAQNANSHVPYISDIGASGVKALFIAAGAVQAVFFVLSLAAERYLRHAGRLEPNRRRFEKILAAFAIVFASIGQIGLILLTILDTYRHHTAHAFCLGIFVVGLGISAFLTSVEFTLLSKSYYEVHWLRLSYILKYVWLFVAISFAIAFAVLIFESDNDDSGAIIEWTLAYWYSIYGIILAIDLLPATKTSQRREKSGGYMLENRFDLPTTDTETGTTSGTTELAGHENPGLEK